jgi:hypothetical protein
MNFPRETLFTLHKHGGKILRITGISHGIDRPAAGMSRDTWHFLGDVQWFDGSKSEGIEIAPWALCYDNDNEAQSRPEVDRLLVAMNEYLAANGEWCGSETKHQGWYAHRPAKKVAK